MKPLIDEFGRVHNYLRLSLTATCNFKCTYCYSGESPPQAVDTSFLLRLTKLFVESGVNKVRLTGGEPLIHKDIIEITKKIHEMPGVENIGLTTNGVLLNRYLEALVTSGLSSLNISLDSLVPAKFAFIAKVDGFKKVWSAIENSQKFLENIKVNCVVMKGVNDDEILDFVELAETRNIRVRFIEFVPYRGNQWSDSRFLPLSEIIKIISSKYCIEQTDLEDPIATNYSIEGFRGSIGVISSLSEPFCHKCNRLRITADGKFKVCLNSPKEIALDSSATDEELLEAIREELWDKPEEHGGVSEMIDNGNRSMTSIGG